MIERIGFGHTPSLSAWTDSFRIAYEPGPGVESYGFYVRSLHELTAENVPSDKAIERLISLSVEGYTASALEALNRLDPVPMPRRQQSAYYRLLGVLHRELGATHGATSAYTHALEMLEEGDPARINIRWDLLALRDDKSADDEYRELRTQIVPITPA